MMKVLGRYIDQHAQHVVITRSGDVVRHTRFTKQADADKFAEIEVPPHFARPMPDESGKRPMRGTHPCAVVGCDRRVRRFGSQPHSDGGRGNWKHVPG